jgi:transposase
LYEQVVDAQIDGMEEYRISAELWAEMKRFLPRMKSRQGKRSLPATEYREILDGIFLLLKTGAQWRALPSCYPPKSTVYERFQLLVRKEFFKKLVSNLAEELLEEGALNRAKELLIRIASMRSKLAPA